MLDFGFYNMDCMEGMKQFPDKFFDLAIVDPPYGINVGQSSMGAGGSCTAPEQSDRESALQAEGTRHIFPSAERRTRNIKQGGGQQVLAERNPSEQRNQGRGVNASLPKSTRLSTTATFRKPVISKNLNEWQNTGLSGVETISLSISEKRSASSSGTRQGVG